MAGLGQRDTNTHGSPSLARSLAKRSIHPSLSLNMWPLWLCGDIAMPKIGN